MMNGVFKKFIGGIAFESIQTYTGSLYNNIVISTPTYKQTNGTVRNSIGINRGTASEDAWKRYNTQLSPYLDLTPIATEDLLVNYNLNDYEVSSIGTTNFTKSRVVNTTGSSLIYAVTVTANEEDINVGCIKFTKKVTQSETNSNLFDVLVCAYYLETPLTISVGTSKTINIAFTVGEMSNI